MTAKHRKPKTKKGNTLKRFTFDAGNSNSGPVGIVIAVEACSKRQATRLGTSRCLNLTSRSAKVVLSERSSP